MTARACLLCGAVLLAAGCGGAQRPHPVAGAPSHGLGGAAPRVDLLARQFLPAGERAPAGFAGYCYLVFADRSSASAPARKAAAEAYLRLFSDVVEAGRSAPPERMALILAPVRTREDAAGLALRPSVERFLGAYDHDRASLLVAAFAHAKRKLPSVAVVSYPTPLEGADAPALEQAWVIDLSAPDQAETTFLTLRDALLVGETPPEPGGPPAAVKALLWVFKQLGYAATHLPELT